MEPLYPLAAQFAYLVNESQLKQTMEESNIALSCEHGSFTIHYGHRYGLPIVIAENHTPGQPSSVWHDHESKVTA